MASKPPPGKEPQALLGDLQHLQSLLERGDAPTPPRKNPSLPTDAIAETDGNGPLDAIDQLLGDDWKTDADEVLQEARRSIDASATAWTPEDTDALNEALRIRIDRTIQSWLAELLSKRVGELRARVLAAMTDEINLRVKEPMANLEPADLPAAIRRRALKDQDGS